MREKEPSNSSAPSPRRLTLPKTRILRGRTNFKSLFSNSITLSSPSVFLRYRIEQSDSPDFKIAFIAPKKIGTAVQRNRTKRLLRETYRLNQTELDPIIQAPLLLHIGLTARKAKLDFNTLHGEVATLLAKLRTRVAEHPLLNT